MKSIIQKIIYYIVSIVATTGLLISAVGAWTGVIAQPGDIITPAKWNELVTYIDAKLSHENIIGAGTISVTASGSNLIISSDGTHNGMAPYIRSTPELVAINSNTILNIEGDYFNPSTNVSIPGFDGSINSVSIISPNSLSIDLTSTANIGSYDLVLSNGSSDNRAWLGNGVNQFVFSILANGNGPAGVYNETFETDFGNWGNTSGINSWTRNSGGTSSNQTGPSAGSLSDWYAYTETSGPGNPGVDFSIETDYFNKIQSVSFDYHMYGGFGGMGSLSFQTYHNGIWTTQWSLNGTQQTTNADPYINHTLDLSLLAVEKIRFFTTSGDFRSDVALDNIIITSI